MNGYGAGLFLESLYHSIINSGKDPVGMSAGTVRQGYEAVLILKLSVW